MRNYLLFALIFAALKLSATEIIPLHKLPSSQLQERINGDAQMALEHRRGLGSVIEYMDARRDLFPPQPPKGSPLVGREDKEAVWAAWQRFLDYTLALDSIERYHSDFHHLKGESKEDSFLVNYLALIARYHAALEFIERAERNPELAKVLNDAVPELGLPAGTYARLKFKHLNVAMATQFAACEVLMKTYNDNRMANVREAIKADAAYVWETGKGRGQTLTAKNALRVVRDGAQTSWLPVQQGVSEWMGHTRVYRQSVNLITEKQIHKLQPILQPGDVLLERREWYLSNIGLPGFWSHAALYIGTAEERRAAFGEKDTRAWVRQQGEASGELEALLKTRSPEACRALEMTDAENKAGPHKRIIEAVGEGVIFSSLEHSASCDSLVVFRPRLPASEKARALAQAFHYWHRPYDFDFDFSTDARLVCTELVYKSYEPASDFTGLKFPFVEMLGRKVTPANELVKQFDAQYGTPAQQFDVVIFLDGQEKRGVAKESTVETLRTTWKRPKWDVFLEN